VVTVNFSINVMGRKQSDIDTGVLVVARRLMKYVPELVAMLVMM